ncbi:hypothetical protein [Chelatococcus asaccharovorans]|uniref:hypothetical protein n=1 Tax=Chelatococcus asaccharovorans TaxID=28210 RepID=UPI00224C7AA4|nr:hypothetical protein [Chelatococcus asaccharovorans]CAH1649654.1 conserved hypothetical protein [Chelatococcus asaccharovorans]CAH1686934.1 conserved hypothetical protein [Chelatococcus asaccharovorans]
MTYSLREISRTLGLSIGRVEQWRSRDYIKPNPSGWTADDAVRLLVLHDLHEIGFNGSEVSFAIDNLRGRNEFDGQFLVISGSPFMQDGPATFKLATHARVVDRDEVGALAANCGLVTIVNLGDVAARARKAFAQ